MGFKANVKKTRKVTYTKANPDLTKQKNYNIPITVNKVH